MSNYAKEALRKDTITDTLIDINDALCEKTNYGDNLQNLSHAEKTIFFIGIFESMVNSDGFYGYLNGSYGKFAKKTIEALKTIEANFTAKLLKEAIAIFENNLDSNGESIQSLDELDDKFYEYNEDLEKMQIDFIKDNINQFKQ